MSDQRCEVHGTTWSLRGPSVEVSPGVFASGLCVECVRDAAVNPKRPSDVDVPAYWRACDGGLECVYHGHRFATDEACSVCLAEDAEVERAT